MSTKKTTTIEELPKFRAGTKKNKVYARWVRDPIAARKYALSLGLKESSITQWFRTWAKDEGKPSAKKAPPKKAAAAKKPAAPKKAGTPAKKAPAKAAPKTAVKKTAPKKSAQSKAEKKTVEAPKAPIEVPEGAPFVVKFAAQAKPLLPETSTEATV